jgi:predicted dehydrogenase
MSDYGTIDWLLVGTGDLARKRVASALASTNHSRLAGVVGQRERAASLAGSYDAGAFETLAEALEKSDAKAVYIATPVDRHVDQALAAMRAGRHVLVEKPLGLSGADAALAVAQAKASGVVAACAYYRRCTPRYLHAAEMLARGELGHVVAVNLCYRTWYDPEPSDPKYWRTVRARAGGGVLADMGCHMFDVLIGLLGMPRSVFAKVATLTHRYEVEDSAAVVIQMPDGAQVTADFHWNSKSWANALEIIGTEGSLTWSPFDAGKVIQTKGRERCEHDLPHAHNVHEPLVADFVRAIRTGEPPAVPLEEAVKTNALLDAVYRSAKSGREVML